MSAATQRPGSDEPCPHCGARSGALPSDGGHHCAVCGGPRIVVQPSVPRPGNEKPLLVSARTAAVKRAGWGIGAGLTTVAAIITGGIALVAGGLFGLGGAVWNVLVALSIGSAVIAALGWTRVARLNAQARGDLRRAEEIVATELLQARGDLSAGELARMMNVTEDRAFELMAHGEVMGLLGSSDGPPERRVRVDDSPPDADDALDEASQATATHRR